MEFGEDCVNELKKYKFLAKGDDVKSGFIIKILIMFLPYNYHNSIFSILILPGIKMVSPLKCRNRANTCERSLCECDKLLAQQHSSRADTWDQQVFIKI